MILRRILMIVCGLSLVSSVAFASDAINTSWGVAMKGYDPVAYFLEQKPVNGNSAYSYKWMEAEWHFASEQNRKLFIENPEKYAPQYGGYCAYGVSQGKKVGIDPQAWTIHDGKLYLNYNLSIRDEKWLPHQNDLILQADDHWPKIK